MTDVSAPTPIETRTLTQVSLEDAMGDDLTIVNAARVSFAKRSEWVRQCSSQPCHQSGDGYECDQCGCSTDRVLAERDAGLINYLMERHHGTPFEHVQFRFRVYGPIRVLREWQRHRTGSFSEMSTRYVEMQPVFFAPQDEDVRVQEGKPGHYVMREAPELAALVQGALHDAYQRAWSTYELLIAQGVAKELAAYALPLGLYSEQIWSVNLRSLLNFVALRNAPDALREIRRAAALVEMFAGEIVPYTMRAFNKHGRVVP